jgi:hypothetical protein
MEDTVKYKNLLVRLGIDMHCEAKAMACKKNQTLSTYVRRALLAAIVKDKKNGL